MKPSEQAQIDFICKLLEKGLQRKDILQEFTKNYKVGIKTFDSRLKIAKEQTQAKISALSNRVDIEVEKEVESRKLASLSVAERIDLLAKMATGEIKVKKPVSTRNGLEFIEVEADHSERKAAIAELNKMDGSYAVTKTEVAEKVEIKVVRE